MACEIELKARIDEEEVADILDRVPIFADFVSETVKEDRYYAPGDLSLGDADFRDPRLFRIRVVGGESVVTLKRKSIECGIEVSEEIEFAVGSAAEFEKFADAIGYRFLIGKRKRSRIHKRGALTIEINEVDGLGFFCEIEFLRPDDEPDIAGCKSRLLEILAELGIPEDAIEGRPYNDLLRSAFGSGRSGHGFAGPL